ncbi:MAG: hypothetical protein E2O79_07085 [Caldithrix sp.]|nr:MAG: hypothetical protein E2O79_07085 [Caldithrix sp.]
MPEVAWQEEITPLSWLEQNQDQDVPRLSDIEFDATPTVNQEKPRLSVYWRDDPSTQAELLSTKDDQVQALIHQIRKSLFISNHESLANKLITLFNVAKEEKPRSLGISIGSLSNFYDFLKLNTKIKNPILSLTPDYNIYASWRGENRTFSAHFLPNESVRFVLFKPNDRHPKHKIRLTGIATSDTLMKIVSPEILKDWVLGER